MCRNIRRLDNFEPPATEEEIHAAALQYVRKICGTRTPSKANERRFQKAVEQIEAASRTLIADWESTAPPRNREEEQAKARLRWQKRRARIRGK